MTDIQLKNELREALRHAEEIWAVSGPMLLMETEFSEAVPSRIPGYPMVGYREPQVDDFIAFVLDLRESSIHLTEEYPAR